MKVLLHICCAPCAVCPYRRLSEEGHEVFGFWYNPNIHPFQEYRRRLDSVKLLEEKRGLKTIYRDDYDIEDFLRRVAFREAHRCVVCYDMRLRKTADVAKRGKFDAFTTTLLQSHHQDHNVIRLVGQHIAHEHGIEFIMEDWREGWQEGLMASKELGLYRQGYCGCVYSERDRYQRRKGRNSR